ncbi:Peptidoglycan-binding LysM [Frankia canadensis]|uniref:Peptidoglycan-binding LysM n=1 Tax=Frankia canadensis TaxID=1836972 RepID=A0A2I2L187_9ACTN|nr:SARP family transcriptional regulator [Frankia canadensis]SNQ51696.1 Peptidoglycan-binding LysM [Frankia canadensis]SOU58986.1 Peptidoglycan-binding LysM [Frankia canadensis]
MLGVGALLSLLLFLLAVPAFLAAWRGNPLPGTWEPGRWSMLASRGYLDPNLLPNGIAALAWLVWAYLSLCIATEALAQLLRSRRRAEAEFASWRARPGARAGWRPPAPRSLRRATARWVALASLVFGLLSSRAALAAGPAASGAYRPPVPASATVGGAAATGDAGRSGPGVLAAIESTHAVRPGETLWSIVRTGYPTARRGDLSSLVGQVFRANEGATDADGRHLHDPNILNPGLTLRLPTLATSGGTSAPTVPPEAGGAQSAPVGTPSTPSSRSGERPTSTPKGSSPPAIVRPTLLAPGSLGPAPQLSPGPVDRGQSGHTSRPELVPIWVGAAGMLTAAVAATISARRHRRDLAVGQRSAPPPPAPRTAALHTAVLANADSEGLARLDVALRALAFQSVPAAAGARTAAVVTGPEPLVVLVRPDDTIDVYLRDPHPYPPSPWEADVDGRIWVLPAAALLPPLPGMPTPCPLLVQLGSDADGAELYVDLEALGVLHIDPGGAGGEGARALGRALLATLALSPLAGGARVEVIGFDPLGLLAEDQVVIAEDLPDLVEQITPGLERLHDELALAGYPSTFTARAAAPTITWDATAAVAMRLHSNADNRQASDDLVELTGGGGQGLAIVTDLLPESGQIDEDSWRLVYDGAGEVGGEPVWRLDPLGLRVVPAQLAADELRDLHLAVDDVGQPPQPIPVPPVEADPEPYTGPDWKVMIGLLGPLTIVARDGRRPPPELVRERTLEVLAWLATHRGRTRTDLEAAIWPTGAQVRSINNQLGRARSLLASVAGEQARQWLPTRRTTITLDPAVITDLDLLHGYVEHAEAHRDHPEIAIAALTDGLDLVRGTPARQPWLDAELGSQLTTTAVRAALLLADHHLTRGDTAAVLGTTRRGLALLPAHPGLFGQRLRAYAAAGDRSAVRAEYDAYLRAEHADPLWDGVTDPDIERLYRILLRQPGHRPDERFAS